MTEKILEKIQFLLKLCCSAILVLMVAIVALQAFSRNFLDYSHVWVEELASICMVWIAFLGAAMAAATGSHTRIDILIRAFPEKVTKLFLILGNLLCTLYSCVLVWYGFVLLGSASQTKTAVLRIPNSINYAALILGAALMAAYFIILVWRDIRELRISGKKGVEE